MPDFKESDYYQEIAKGINDLILGNLPQGSKIRVVPLIGELCSEIRKLEKQNQIDNKSIIKLAHELGQLKLDISFLFIDEVSEKYELLILEVKKISAVGLSEFSQLIGYCLVAKAKFGLLINVDKPASPPLRDLLLRDVNLSLIKRQLDSGTITHKLGFMKWNSVTKNIDYAGLGELKDIPTLVKLIVSALD